MRLTKQQFRARYRELQDLVIAWDPIGVSDMPDWPRDEYDCLVDSVLSMLARNATEDEISAALIATVHDHMGLVANPVDVAGFCAKATAWYRERWAKASA